MHFQVTTEHIQAGQRQDPERCPSALAIQEQTGMTAMIVGSGYSLRGNGKFLSGRVPNEVIIFEAQFDDNQPVEPYAFQLSLPALEQEGK